MNGGCEEEEGILPKDDDTVLSRLLLPKKLQVFIRPLLGLLRRSYAARWASFLSSPLFFILLLFFFSFLFLAHYFVAS